MQSVTIEAEPRREPLSHGELQLIDTWWRTANYLSVDQIYLLDNRLLREPLRPEHTSSRGCWATGGRRRA
jgi:xylulose-5-phosphate/fructose-6-phosphate phosphoketolase